MSGGCGSDSLVALWPSSNPALPHCVLNGNSIATFLQIFVAVVTTIALE